MSLIIWQKKILPLGHHSFQPPTPAPIFEDTDHLSINWSKDDKLVEVVDGCTGRIVTESTTKSDTVSRLSKLKFYSSCMHLSETSGRSLLQENENYYIAKQSAQSYQESKRLLFTHLRERGLGYWINRPNQVNGFKV